MFNAKCGFMLEVSCSDSEQLRQLIFMYVIIAIIVVHSCRLSRRGRQRHVGRGGVMYIYIEKLDANVSVSALPMHSSRRPISIAGSKPKTKEQIVSEKIMDNKTLQTRRPFVKCSKTHKRGFAGVKYRLSIHGRSMTHK